MRNRKSGGTLSLRSSSRGWERAEQHLPSTSPSKHAGPSTLQERQGSVPTRCSPLPSEGPEGVTDQRRKKQEMSRGHSGSGGDSMATWQMATGPQRAGCRT